MFKLLFDARPFSRQFDWPSSDVFQAFEALGQVDSVTIDPHKLGYIPYQAGAVVFRDRRVRNLISYFAPYVFDAEKDQHQPALLGSYILEGSKAGAAAAAVWTAHQVVGLDLGGYGKIIGEGILGARRFYRRICEQKAFDSAGGKVRIIPLMDPDLNIVVYAFNREGCSDLSQMNALNRKIKERLSYAPGTAIYAYDFMVSSTALERQVYGDSPKDFLRRAGITESEWERVGEVFVLRSCIMSPYLTPDFTEVDYLGELFAGFARVTAELG